MAPLLILLICAFVGTAAQAQSPIDSFNAVDVAEGGRLFRIHCARCHGIRGEGGEGADLNRPMLRYAQDDETLYAVISNGIPGTGMPGTFGPGPADLWRIAAYVRSLGNTESGEPPGDAVRGRELFLTKGGCTTCHIAAGVGNGIGPELSDVGARRGVEYLRQSLVEPAAVQARGAPPLTGAYLAFLTVRARVADGDEVEGVRVNEDAFTIQIRDLSGRLHSVRKHDVVAVEKVFGHSLMPGYDATMTAGEIDHVISYLLTLRGDS